jgi:hypothetical protein
VIRDGKLIQTSVSQAELFEACARHYWFDYAKGYKDEQRTGASEGDKGHALLAEVLSSGALPAGRRRMKKAVEYALLKPNLPWTGVPRELLQVERRFDGSTKPTEENAAWPPLDYAKTLTLGGIPWDGFIDLAWVRDGVATVIDHKFSADIVERRRQLGKQENSTQLIVYAAALARTGVGRFNVGWHLISRSGTTSDVAMKNDLDGAWLVEGCAKVAHTVGEMQKTAKATEQNDVPFNRARCFDFGGCPHQSICEAFKGRQIMMTPEEMDVFGMAAPAVAAPVALEAPTILPPDAPPSSKDTPLPDKAKKKPMMIAEVAAAPDGSGLPLFPSLGKCPDCAAEVTKENGSLLRSGAVKHIGCTATKAPAKTPPSARALALSPEDPPRRDPVTPQPSAQCSNPEIPKEGTNKPDLGIPVTIELGPKSLAILGDILALLSGKK